MIEISFLFVEFVYTAIWIITRFAIWIKKKHIDRKREFLLNVIGNMTMFIPSGIVLPIVYKRLDTFCKVLTAGAGISLCIEIIQLPFSVRATDVDDLILNTIGVIVGYGIYSLVRCFLKRAKG